MVIQKYVQLMAKTIARGSYHDVDKAVCSVTFFQEVYKYTSEVRLPLPGLCLEARRLLAVIMGSVKIKCPLLA